MVLITRLSQKTASALSGGLVVLVAVLVMVGWHFDIGILKTLIPGYVTMRFNTAVALFFFGSCQLALGVSRYGKTKQVSFSFLMLAMSIGILTLIQYVFHVNFGIDEFFYLDADGGVSGYPPGRLAPVTAISFILLGLSVFFAFFKSQPWYRLSQILLVVTTLIPFQALVGYVLGIQTSFGLASHSRMAIHTAVGLIFLSVGFLSLMYRRGYMPVLLSSSAAGVTARRLLVAAIFAPPFFSFFERLGVEYQLFPEDFGTLLRVVGSVIFFVVMIWRSTEKLHQSLREQRRQQNKLVRKERDMTQALAAQKEAVRATQVKTDFLNSMSHELRTPLNGMKGMLALLGNTELNSLQKNMLQTMEASSQVLLNLINQILDLSKIEAGKIELSENHFELRSLVDSTIAIVDLPAREKQLILAPQIHTEAHGYYLGDSFRVQQIILNLLHNAIKFSDRGIVTLKIEKVCEVDSDSTLRFEIIDNGIGLDEEGVQKLFQAFSQVETTQYHAHSGAGLGLAISKKIVELMNGRIGVESKKGVGSKFFFEIKLKTSEFVKTPAHSLGESSIKTTEKIEGHVLVAEDNKVNQKVVCSLLETLGCTTKTVENGVAAIEALCLEHFDIILMDGQMPVMDGYEAARRIRKGDAGPENLRIPIMAVTANVVQGNMQNCYDAGMNDFMGKPIDFDDFAYKIKKWISRGRDVIDKKAIEVLQQLAGAGNKNLIRDLVNLFKQETAPALKDIRASIESGDFVSAAKTAHHLKSSCANLGAYKMQELTEKIEKSKLTANKEQMLEFVYALEQEFEIASSELQKLVAS